MKEKQGIELSIKDWMNEENQQDDLNLLLNIIDVNKKEVEQIISKEQKPFNLKRTGNSKNPV